MRDSWRRASRRKRDDTVRILFCKNYRPIWLNDKPFWSGTVNKKKARICWDQQQDTGIVLFSVFLRKLLSVFVHQSILCQMVSLGHRSNNQAAFERALKRAMTCKL